MQRGPRGPPSDGGTPAHAVEALMIVKRRRPPCQCTGSRGRPKEAEARAALRQGPGWSQTQRGLRATSVGALVVPNRRRIPRQCGAPSMISKPRRPPCQCNRGLGGPNGKEVPTPIRKGALWPKPNDARVATGKGPRWSLGEGDPYALAEAASRIQNRRWPPRNFDGSLGDPKATEVESYRRGLHDP